MQPPAQSRDERAQQFIKEVPPKYQATIRRAVIDGKASPRQAIKAQCLACVGFVREDVTNCTSAMCPLWHHRPYQQEGGEDAEQE
jgi:hypothetical protein